MVEKDELCDHLWHKYFLPEKPLTSKERKEIMLQYNEVAKEINTIAGFKRVIILTPSTRWFPKKTDREDKTKSQVKAVRGSIIEQIINLFKQGKTNKEIIMMGYNKSTVSRQISEYKKNK